MPEMTRTDLYYKSGYKYQLDKRYFVQTDIYPQEDIITDYISLLKSGLMIIERGYTWDGASGPAINTANVMAASLIHDAGYQLISEGYLDESFKGQFDMLLRQVMDEDSCNETGLLKGILCSFQRFRAEYFFDAVDVFGYGHIKAKKQILCIKAGGSRNGD